jgi:hypothetical protein
MAPDKVDRHRRISFGGWRMNVEHFLHTHNLALFRKRLAESNDDAQRLQIKILIAEEEAKNLCELRRK